MLHYDILQKIIKQILQVKDSLLFAKGLIQTYSDLQIKRKTWKYKPQDNDPQY